MPSKIEHVSGHSIEGIDANEEAAQVQNRPGDGRLHGERQRTISSDIMQTILEVKQLPSPANSRDPSPGMFSEQSSVEKLEMDQKLRHKPSGSLLEPPFSRTSSATSIETRSPVLIPKTELQDIPEEVKRPIYLSQTKSNGQEERNLRISTRELQGSVSELAPHAKVESSARNTPLSSLGPSPFMEQSFPKYENLSASDGDGNAEGRYRANSLAETLKNSRPSEDGPRLRSTTSRGDLRPNHASRTLSTPPIKSPWPKSNGSQSAPMRKPLNPDQIAETIEHRPSLKQSKSPSESSHVPHLPLPPMSIHTYLQLELSSSRPSPLYINPSPENQYPYESSKIKFERLLNFLLLPPQLEHVLWFGALACLDAWLHTFTILPLRFFKALGILVQWWGEVFAKEFRFISGFIYHGSGRMWHRRRGRGESIESTGHSRSSSRSSRPAMSASSSFLAQKTVNGGADKFNFENLQEASRRSKPLWGRRHHRRTKSQPSRLSSNHKADILQGLVIICSCLILMRFDASRMYHSIRGQAAIKLYVIYNVLEVGDRLFSALGQDIFECLYSDETLERNPDGRSKILRPFGMFLLALAYNVFHAAALFYQVITLNVAVNSYSNALLTLLMSNQFVEIKSTVFKKFEKENLFQLTCADVVERFQLWLMLLIIAMRNVVEVGGLSIMNHASESTSPPVEVLRNTSTTTQPSYFLLPDSFTLLPSWAGEVLSPFLVVLGSEMMVDWLKHAYVSKFNNVKPAVYEKFLDVLAKDYYNNAFYNQNLVKRLGLPVIPLSCLFIRASVQTYHMFLATQLPTPILSTATALSVESAATTSPATTAVLEHFDAIIRSALGRSAFGTGFEAPSVSSYFLNTDDFIALLTMVVFFLFAFIVLLAFKLILGMVLLTYARGRYKGMRDRENKEVDTKGRRVGGWGMVEVGEESRRAIYEGDDEGLKRVKDKEKKPAENAKDKAPDFGKVVRYELGSSKRIW